MKCQKLIWLVLLVGATVSGEEPFSVKIVDYGARAPLGSKPWLTIQVRNDSGKVQPTAFTRTRVGVEVLTAPEGSQPHRYDRPDGEGRRIFIRPESLLAADWVFHKRIPVPVDVPGAYTIRAYFREDPGAKVRIGEPEEHWSGKVYSESITVWAEEPAGVDQKAFNTIVNQVSEDAGDLLLRFSKAFLVFDTRSQLFRQFPESTYTADQVLRYCTWMPWQDNENVVSHLAMGVENLWNSVPCDHTECAGTGSVPLAREDYVRWQIKWFKRVLEFHPDIWFADDIRFHLGFDYLLLGQKGPAEEEFQTLAEKNDSPWAVKTRDLIQQLKAKGMLDPGPRAQEGPD